MNNFIENYTSLMSTGQAAQFNAALNVDRSSSTMSEDQLTAEINSLLANIANSKMVMQLRLQSSQGQSNSQDYNDTLKEIIADLNTLYTNSNNIDLLLSDQVSLNKTILAELEKDLARLENKIEALNMLADNNEGYSTASRENFSDQALTETDRVTYDYLFRDQFGNPIVQDAKVDIAEGTLKLDCSSSYNRIHPLDNMELTSATISVLEQTGQGFADPDPRFGIDKAIDSNMDTFWGVVILADGVLNVPLKLYPSIDATGALCSFKITFPSACSVSQFTIKPYCEFPMDICAIGYTRDNTDNVYGWCMPPTDPPVTIEKTTCIDFPLVIASSLIITIRQNHANKHFYFISTSEISDKQMWNNIANAERDLTFSNLWIAQGNDDPHIDQDKVDQFDTRWQQYLSATRSYQSSQTSSVLISALAGAVAYNATQNKTNATQDKTSTTQNQNNQLRNGIAVGVGAYGFLNSINSAPAKPDRQQVEKYEYVYGAYDMGVRGQEYYPVGIYVSRPHPIVGNIQRCVLQASEWHPKFYDPAGLLIGKKMINYNGSVIQGGDPLRKTSVEYYLSCGDSQSDIWFPVLPVGSGTNNYFVNNEFLTFMTAGKTETRFYVDTTQSVQVYRDGEPIPSFYVTISPKDIRQPYNNFKVITINPFYWNANSIYTIDYFADDTIPGWNPFMIDFLLPSGNVHGTSIKHITEYFNGSPSTKSVDKNCSAKLDHYPFVNRGNVSDLTYNPVKIALNPPSYIFTDPTVDNINGPTALISTEIDSTRDPAANPSPPARLLNRTSYADGVLPVLNPYDLTNTHPCPTFEYYHDGARVYFTETFRHDGAPNNYEVSHGNAVVQVDYDYLVSGVRCKVIMRRTDKIDTSVTPKVDWYSIKFLSLT